MTKFRRFRAFFRVMRLDLSFAAGICVVGGEVVASGSAPALNEIFLGFIVGFFISSSVLILNDYFDVEIDRINMPARPLPSGLIRPSEVILLSIFTMFIGIITAFLIGYVALFVAISLWIIGFLYDWKFKRTGLPGNLMVSTSVALTFIFGGITVGILWNPIIWCFSSIAFFFNLGEEIAGDAMDVIGDEKMSSDSIAIKMGRTDALKISGVLFGIVVFISFIPVVYGWLGTVYLVFVLFMDLVIVYSVIKLFNSQNIDEGRNYIRLIYLGATIGLLGFIVGQIIL